MASINNNVNRSLIFQETIMSMKMAPTHGPASGYTWDDGPHENVREIQISHDFFGINFVKFDYIEVHRNLTGEQYYKTGEKSHGKKSRPALSPITEKFLLESDEYMTKVKAYVQFTDNAIIGNVMMLKFKTNRRTSKAYGVDPLPGKEYKKIVLGEKNKKIVGFHGNTGERFLHTIGVSLNKTKALKHRVYKVSSSD